MDVVVSSTLDDISKRSAAAAGLSKYPPRGSAARSLPFQRDHSLAYELAQALPIGPPESTACDNFLDRWQTMVWSSFKASLIGLLIAFVAILPPFVHLVTGPLGPAIGGFVAGGREKADFRIALVTGLFMGAFIGALGVVAIAIVWAVSKSIPQSGLQITAGDAVALSLAITTYATVMSTIGASLGGYIARKKDTSQPASGLEDRAGGG